jgi:hypothetical protein
VGPFSIEDSSAGPQGQNVRNGQFGKLAADIGRVVTIGKIRNFTPSMKGAIIFSYGTGGGGT